MRPIDVFVEYLDPVTGEWFRFEAAAEPFATVADALRFLHLRGGQFRRQDQEAPYQARLTLSRPGRASTFISVLREAKVAMFPHEGRHGVRAQEWDDLSGAPLEEVAWLFFDTMVNSRAFRSGEDLGDEEVSIARELARLLGEDPMLATPITYSHQIRHQWAEKASMDSVCAWCGMDRNDPFGAHGGEEEKGKTDGG